MSALGNIGGKELGLNRRQRHLAFRLIAQAINRIGGWQSGCRLRQRSHGLMAKNILGRQLPAGLAGAADHLQRHDGVAAQLEEIILDADRFQAEHFLPNPHQLPLGVVARFDAALADPLRLRQRLAVQFAVGQFG